MPSPQQPAAWYTKRFGTCKPEWFVFPFGRPLATDPTRPITSFKTAWTKVRKEAGVKGRWHDNRHTVVTELAESGVGDEAKATSSWRRYERTTRQRHSSSMLARMLPNIDAKPTCGERREVQTLRRIWLKWSHARFRREPDSRLSRRPYWLSRTPA